MMPKSFPKWQQISSVIYGSDGAKVYHQNLLRLIISGANESADVTSLINKMVHEVDCPIKNRQVPSNQDDRNAQPSARPRVGESYQGTLSAAGRKGILSSVVCFTKYP